MQVDVQKEFSQLKDEVESLLKENLPQLELSEVPSIEVTGWLHQHIYTGTKTKLMKVCSEKPLMEEVFVKLG